MTSPYGSPDVNAKSCTSVIEVPGSFKIEKRTLYNAKIVYVKKVFVYNQRLYIKVCKKKYLS